MGSHQAHHLCLITITIIKPIKPLSSPASPSASSSSSCSSSFPHHQHHLLLHHHHHPHHQHHHHHPPPPQFNQLNLFGQSISFHHIPGSDMVMKSSINMISWEPKGTPPPQCHPPRKRPTQLHKHCFPESAWL